MSQSLHALIVEDVESDALLLVAELKRGDFDVVYERVETAAAMRTALEREPWDVILCDFTMPYFSGDAALRVAKQSGPDVPFIYVSGTIGEDVAIEAMKSGAQDYIMKTNLTRLVPAIRRELQEARVRRESRRAEAAMRESEHKYRHLFEALGDAVFLLDENTGRILDTNSQAEALLGLPRGEIVGANLVPLLVSGRPGFDTLRAAAAGERRGGCELELQLKDGARVPVQATASHIELHGRPLLLTVLRDVTERNRMEEQLRQLSRAMEQSPASIVITDTDGNIRYVNAKFIALTGYSFAEVYGKNPRLLKSGRMPPESYRDLWAAITAGKEWHGEFLNKKKNGELYWEAASISPVVNEQGVTTHFLAVKEDITERKRMEGRLRKVSELQASLHVPATLPEKLRHITDAVVDIFNADFARIWLMRPGDRCEAGCLHAEVKEGPHVCRHREHCLHLLASSGRYTHLDGREHSRIPFGCYKVGRIASGEQTSFFTNDVLQDPEVHNQEWVRSLGLASFAGYQLCTPGGTAIGVLALFSQNPITSPEDALLRGISNLVVPAIQATAAEMAVRESEDRFRGLVETSSDWIWEVNEHLAYTYVSPRVRELLGYEPEEMRGKTPFDFMPPDEAQRIAATLGPVVEQHQPIRALANTNQHKGGRLVVLESNGLPVFDAAGTFRGYRGVDRDITERKRAMEALAFNHAILKTQQETSLDGILVVDEHARFISFNQRFVELWGLPPDVLATGDDRLALKFVAEQLAEPEAFLDHVRHLYEHKNEKSQEEIRLKNGKVFDRYSAPMVSPAGRYYGRVWFFRDITERKRAEEMMRDSDQRMRLATEATGVGIWEWNLASNSVRWDAQMFRIYGLDPTPDGFIQYDEWREAVLPEDFPEQEAALRTTVQRLGHGAREFRIRRRSDGQVRFIQSVEAVRTGAQGKAEWVVGTNLDITERKQAEAALARERQLLRMLMLSLPDAIYFKDRESRFTQINPAQARRFGLRDPAQAVGKTDFDFFTEDHARPAFEDEQAIIRTGRPVVEKEEKETWPDGRITWVATTKMPLRNDAGEIIGTFGISRDITEHKLAEEKIREQAALLDKAQDAIFVMDLTGHITYWSHGAERLSGWTAREAIGQSPVDLLFRGLPPPQLRECMKTTEEHGEWMGELEEFTKEGKHIFVQGRSTLIRDEQDRPKGILVIDTDITEKKLLEARFLRAQRMESIGTLAGGIAHDLNNVLSPILMSVQLLKEEAKSDNARKMLDILEASAKRGTALVKQVLTFGRGIAGQRLLIPPRRLLYEMESIIRETFPKSIEFTSRYAPDLRTVTGDATQLHQVLLNLCVNARDAMPQGGKLFIEMENRMFDDNQARLHPESKPGPYVVISVCDTGTGMSREVQDKIFDPFFTTKAPDRGTGLGLSTSLGIVKSHGGFIDCYSEPGKGTTFRVYLPASVEPASDTGFLRAATALPRGDDELVLVVDDEEGIREFAKGVLERFGYRVLLARDGAEAVALYRSRQKEIAAVLTDMMMPVMDGPAAIVALKAINPAVKILGSSGLNVHFDLGKAAALGVKNFLTKPYTVEALLRMLQEVLHPA